MMARNFGLSKRLVESAATTAGPSHLNPKPPFGLLGAAANSFSSAAILPVGSNSGSAVFSRSALPAFIPNLPVVCCVLLPAQDAKTVDWGGISAQERPSTNSSSCGSTDGRAATATGENTPAADINLRPHDSTLRILKLQRAQ